MHLSKYLLQVYMGKSSHICAYEPGTGRRASLDLVKCIEAEAKVPKDFVR